MKLAKRFNLGLSGLIALGIFVTLSLWLSKNLFKKTTEVYVDLTPLRGYGNQTISAEYWEVDRILGGDVVFDTGGSEVGRVVNVDRYYFQDGKYKMELSVKLRVSDFGSGVGLYGKPLRIGEKMSLVIDSKLYEGTIKNIYKDWGKRFEGYKKAKGVVKISLRSYEPWQAEALKNFEVKDSSGEVILKVLKAEITPATVYVEAQSNKVRLMLGQDPWQKDVMLTAEMPKLRCFQEVCYYNEYNPISIGMNIEASNGKTFFGFNSSIVESKIEYVE